LPQHQNRGRLRSSSGLPAPQHKPCATKTFPIVHSLPISVGRTAPPVFTVADSESEAAPPPAKSMSSFRVGGIGKSALGFVRDSLRSGFISLDPQSSGMTHSSCHSERRRAQNSSDIAQKKPPRQGCRSGKAAINENDDPWARVAISQGQSNPTTTV
jgi:hypothetical protein